MLQLFTVAPANPKSTDTSLSDPRTSFREMQAQDVVLWANTIYEANFARVLADPNDTEAVAWFRSDSRGNLTFLHCCEIFNIDPDTIRASIPNNRGKNHE